MLAYLKNSLKHLKKFDRAIKTTSFTHKNIFSLDLIATKLLLIGHLNEKRHPCNWVEKMQLFTNLFYL